MQQPITWGERLRRSTAFIHIRRKHLHDEFCCCNDFSVLSKLVLLMVVNIGCPGNFRRKTAPTGSEEPALPCPLEEIIIK